MGVRGFFDRERQGESNWLLKCSKLVKFYWSKILCVWHSLKKAMNEYDVGRAINIPPYAYNNNMNIISILWHVSV